MYIILDYSIVLVSMYTIEFIYKCRTEMWTIENHVATRAKELSDVDAIENTFYTYSGKLSGLKLCHCIIHFIFVLYLWVVRYKYHILYIIHT